MKNSILELALAIATAGGLFAQTEGEFPATEQEAPGNAATEQAVSEDNAKEKKRAMNAITVDLGPAIAGIGIGFGAGAALGSGKGFGIGAQYERHITEMFSVAGRFSFMYTDLSTSFASMNMQSYSIEGHGRIYPLKGAFFLDAMAGYANFGMDISSSFFSDKYNMHYLKLGGKLGWKIAFGKRRGGFTFEPALGYNAGIALGGKKFGNANLGDVDKLLQEYRDYIPSDILSQFSQLNSFVNGNLNMLPDTLGQFVYAGGPRVTLAFGYAF